MDDKEKVWDRRALTRLAEVSDLIRPQAGDAGEPRDTNTGL